MDFICHVHQAFDIYIIYLDCRWCSQLIFNNIFLNNQFRIIKKINLKDRYVYDHESINDMNNDVELLNGFESNGYTVFKIKRPLLVCDPDDRSIEVFNF